MEEINYVCSLGFNCHTATFLKSNKLKLASYPFDWIVSDIRILYESLKDDFSDFLNRDLYLDLSQQNRCGHKKYCYNMFHHHNPLNKDTDYLYFNRCVNRFRNLLKTIDPKLFIITIINEEHGIGNSLTDEKKNIFIDFNNFFKNYTENYKILIIVNYSNKTCNNHKITNIDNLIFLEMDSLSKSSGTSFYNSIDNTYLSNIIKEIFKFNLKNIT